MTDSFNNYTLDEILKLIPKEVSQVTFKRLIDSHGVNKMVDEYIKAHHISDDTLDRLKRDIANYKGNLSIRLDMECMKCDGRYKIFREDGKVYDNWDSEE